MKRLVFALTCGLLMLPLAAFAQPLPLSVGALEFSATGGASVPFGDFNTVAEPGFGIGGQGAMYVMPNLAIGGSIHYNSYGVDALFSDPSLNLGINIWEFTGQAKYTFMPGPVTPYAKAALGVFRSSFEALGVSSSVNDMGIGGGIGAQLRLPASNLGFFGEAIAYSVFTDNSSTNYYTVRGGINIYMSPKP